MTQKIIRDVYKFSAGESAEMIEAYGSEESALDGAIQQAREQARIFALPARWEAKMTESGIVVYRFRAKIA